LKSTTQAYAYVITLYRLGKLTKLAESPNPAAQADSYAAA
jgi:hypothetical protein